MKHLYRKMAAIDKLFYKYLLMDVKFNVIIITSIAFLLGVYIQAHTILTFLISAFCVLAMAITLYNSVKLTQRQKKLMNESKNWHKLSIKKYKSNNDGSQ